MVTSECLTPLPPQRTLLNSLIHPSGVSTVGSMDLGGASTQLAFQVGEELKGEDFLPVRLYGYDYNVYTHSYLCYGKNEAANQIMDRMIKVRWVSNQTRLEPLLFVVG